MIFKPLFLLYKEIKISFKVIMIKMIKNKLLLTYNIYVRSCLVVEFMNWHIQKYFYMMICDTFIGYLIILFSLLSENNIYEIIL